MLDGIIQTILVWVSQYPIFATILMVVGVLRLVMKPLMSFLHEFVLATPGEGDNVLLDKIEKSPIFSTIMYVLDWLASIKFPKAGK